MLIVLVSIMMVFFFFASYLSYFSSLNMISFLLVFLHRPWIKIDLHLRIRPEIFSKEVLLDLGPVTVSGSLSGMAVTVHASSVKYCC